MIYSSSYPRQSHNFDEATSLDSDKRKSRWCLITLIIFSIVITLISVVGLIIAIYSLVLNNSKNGAITTVTNSNTTTVPVTTLTTSFLCSSSPATYYQYTTLTPPQCLNYTTDTDATRNIGYTTSINFCDNKSPFTNATSVWFRFQEPAGTLMANSPIPPNYCGTVVTGWYAGQYPSTVFTTVT
ncbi:unnamed protein product, partial [Rotaria sp. Silwood1]